VSIVTGDYVSEAAAANAVATKQLTNLPLIAAGDNNLYAQLVVRGTPTYASTSDITVKIVVELNRD
jgi:hypothetical protein